MQNAFFKGELILVPGHALLADHTQKNQPLEYYKNPKHWILQDFQRGEIGYYFEHIQQGLRALKGNPQAILVFSGGRTRKGGKKWSEAASYLTVARAMPEWEPSFENRVISEDYARDSLQNLCFSLLCYFSFQNAFPQKVWVVNWGFKKERFHFHAKTLGLSEAEFEYLSFGFFDPEKHAHVSLFEKKAFDAFKEDPFGLRGDLWEKKVSRDLYGDGNPYENLIKHLPYPTDLKKLAWSMGHRNDYAEEKLELNDVARYLLLAQGSLG